MSKRTQRMIRRARTTSNRTRLLIGLATGVVALTTFVAVAWAESTVYFVGDYACHANVGAGSDQIDNGWSYDHYVDAGPFIGQCNAIYENGAYVRAYANKSDGSWPCGNTGFGHIVATCNPPYPYVRAHCVNLSGSSSRWMSCYKVKQ
jgi:hypothetical protein